MPEKSSRFPFVTPSGVLTCPGGCAEGALCIWAGSGWAGTEVKVALSSGEAELNSVVKELPHVLEWIMFVGSLFIEENTVFRVDASACEDILRRRGAWKVKNLSANSIPS